MAFTVGYGFSLQSSAQACAAPVDLGLGYPATGVDVPGGSHVKPPFVTQTYAQPMLASGLWWYPADPTTTPILTPLTVQLALPIPAPIPIAVAVLGS